MGATGGDVAHAGAAATSAARDAAGRDSVAARASRCDSPNNSELFITLL